MDRLRAVCILSVLVSFVIFSSSLKWQNVETPRFACRGWQRNHTHTRDRRAKQATRADHIRPRTWEPKSPAKPRWDSGLLQVACGSSRAENQASRRLSEVDGGWKWGIEGKTSELWVVWVNGLLGECWKEMTQKVYTSHSNAFNKAVINFLAKPDLRLEFQLHRTEQVGGRSPWRLVTDLNTFSSIPCPNPKRRLNVLFCTIEVKTTLAGYSAS